MMDRVEELTIEIRKLNQKVQILVDRLQGPSKRWVPIPEASRILGICQAKLRTMCDDGTIPSAKTSTNPKKRHYLVDILGSQEALARGGYLNKVKPGPKKGRKPTTSLQ